MKMSDVLNEGRHDGNWMKDGVEMCSKDCCGQPVTECTCGPSCKHCDCYEKNKAMNETTTAGAVAAVAAPVGGMISRNNTGKNALDSDQNLMGGPKRKKKKRNNG